MRVDRLIPSIMEVLKELNLHARLQDLVSEKKWQLISDRDSRSGNHFTDSNYENYGTWTRGVKMSNIAKYNDFVDNYIRDLRRELNGFKVQFRIAIDSYLNRIQEELVRLNIGINLSENFMLQVKGLVPQLIEKHKYSVEHYGLNNKLNGNPQKDIYRNEFNQHFSDVYISKLLDNFESILSNFNFSEESNYFKDNVHTLASNMREKLVKAIQKPSEKQNLLDNTMREIERLKEKVIAIDSCINNIESYTN